MYLPVILLNIINIVNRTHISFIYISFSAVIILKTQYIHIIYILPIIYKDKS